MAVQRIDPRLQALHHYPPRRNLDHKSIIESVMTAIQNVDSRRTTDTLDMLRTERDEMIRERNALLSTDQPDRFGQQLSAVNEAPGTSFAASNEWLNEQMTPERYQKLRDQLTDLVRQNKEDDKQAMKMMLRLTDQQLIRRTQLDEQSNIHGKS